MHTTSSACSSRRRAPRLQLKRPIVRFPRNTEARAASSANRDMDNRHMTAHTLRRWLVGSVVSVGLVAGGAPWGGARTAAAQEQSLYIAFTDFNGAPVTDMTRDDVVIEWDGVGCEIVELEPIEWPVRVTVYVDNATESQAALPDMREGLRLFLNALPPDIEVAIATTAGRPQFRVRHTRDRGDLLDAVGVLASEGSAATFFDALYEEAERLEDDREREYLSAIVMVAVAGSEGSRPGPGRRDPADHGPPLRQRGGRPHAAVHRSLRRRAHPGPSPGHLGKRLRRVDPGSLRGDGRLHPLPRAAAGDRGGPRPQAPDDPQSVPGDLPAAGRRVRPAAPPGGGRRASASWRYRRTTGTSPECAARLTARTRERSERGRAGPAVPRSTVGPGRCSGSSSRQGVRQGRPSR